MPASNAVLQALSAFVPLLRCPVSGEALHLEGAELVSAGGQHRYPVSPAGIPLFAGDYCSPEALIQQQHYDKVVTGYVANLTYPHTQAYMQYLDEALRGHVAAAARGTVIEVCCGHGEAFLLFGESIQQGIGVDISGAMLEQARQALPAAKFAFLQGDATCLPVQAGAFDTVIMLGGIHHVNNRAALFSEIYRILKPAGRFYWREPVSDLFLWRWLRAVVYRLSPALDADTEAPLHYRPTRQQLLHAGFDLTLWQTYGLIGFMLFMNSDVLFFNRLFRFIPGIQALVRLSARLDDALLRLPGLSRYGLQVIGCAVKRPPEAR
ncbi:MAG: class I SAM-dependent methyltransferase [Anaerolineae bacterium]|jgi:SAM-dependent methyltransferase|nr:class I SAM-dependent methyltransferase [Anaerolineae bacterium]